jgi:general secretion pathway protein D
VPAGKILLNFRNAPVDAVLDHLSRAAGFIIIKDVPVSGTVDVMSQQPMSPEEAVDLLNRVLARQDLAAVQSDRVLRIVSRATALKADLPVETGADPDAIERSEAMATQIIPVKHADAAKMVENLKPLLGEKSQLSANASSNALVLTDTKTNIRRMVKIVQALDTSISNITEIRVFPLEHAEAEDLAKVINDVFEEPQSQTQNRRNPMEFFRRMRGGGPGGGNDEGTGTSEAKTAAVKVTAVGDERSNSVVVSASAEMMQQIANLVKQVDVPTQDDAIVEVFTLKYADAEDTVDVLKGIYSDTKNQNTNIPGQRRFGFFGSMRGGPGGMGTPSTNSSSRSLGQADVSLVADTRTNSLVVSASPTTMAAIRKIIEKLDATPKNVTQVYIYKIENADLENLQEILEGMFDDIEDTGTTTNLAPGGGAARSGATGTTGTRRN